MRFFISQNKRIILIAITILIISFALILIFFPENSEVQQLKASILLEPQHYTIE